MKDLSSPRQLAMLHKLYDDKTNSIEQICETMHIPRATLYRYLKRAPGSV